MKSLIVKPEVKCEFENEMPIYPIVEEVPHMPQRNFKNHNNPLPITVNIIQQDNGGGVRDIARVAGEAFVAMKAHQDEYGNNISQHYAPNDKVNSLQEEVDTLKERALEGERTFATKNELENYVNQEEMNTRVREVEQAAIQGAKFAIENYGVANQMDFATEDDIDDLF